jgi:hypothetical protein
MLGRSPARPESRIGYRIAHGEAARLEEMGTFDHAWGCVFAAGVGCGADAIARDVMRRFGSGIRAR